MVLIKDPHSQTPVNDALITAGLRDMIHRCNKMRRPSILKLRVWSFQGVR